MNASGVEQLGLRVACGALRPKPPVEFLPDKSKNAELRAAIERLGRTEDVVRIALMPDAHVAEDVCVGTVTATTRRLLPAAVGGDIGCGMVAVRLQSDA